MTVDDKFARAFAKEHGFGERATCPKRSLVCGTPMPCHESACRPGTCLWCRMPVASERPEPAPDDWYFIDGVRYCARCRTRRCVRQKGGTLPCPDDGAPIHPSDLRGLRFRR